MMQDTYFQQPVTQINLIALSGNTFCAILGWFGQGADLGIHEVNSNMVACISICAL